MYRRLIVQSFALAAIATGAAADAAAPLLECRLHLPAQVRTGAPVPLRFELINHGKSRLRVLTWNTPLEGWFGSYLRVVRDGEEIPYRGPQVKRGAPEAGDYVALGAGKRAGATVDLAQVYAMIAPGRYQVEFEGRLHDVTAAAVSAAKQSAYSPRCNPATVDIIATR